MKRFKRAADIKVGVVGYGGQYNMGRHHLKEMARAAMTPAAVAEIDPQRLAAAKTDFPGIGTFSSVEEMLRKSDVDLVAIITPHNTHAPLALKCLRAGRHVAVEKPLAVTTAECDAMIAAARRAGVVLSTYHNRHWDGCITEAVRRIRAGTIGDVYRVEAHMGAWGQPGNWWRTSRTISGGILYDWGVHLLEYSFQIIDADMVEVAGFAKEGFWAPKTAWKKDTIEDEGFGVIRFDSGQWLTLCYSQLDSNPKRGIAEITGTKGSYIMDHRGWEITTHQGPNTVVTRGKNPEGEGWRFYQNVADHLVKGEKLVITPEWSRRPIHALDLMVRSAKRGRSLRTKYK